MLWLVACGVVGAEWSLNRTIRLKDLRLTCALRISGNFKMRQASGKVERIYNLHSKRDKIFPIAGCNR